MFLAKHPVRWLLLIFLLMAISAVVFINRRQDSPVQVLVKGFRTNETGAVEISLVVKNPSRRGYQLLDSTADTNSPVFFKELPDGKRQWTGNFSGQWNLHLMPNQSMETTLLVTNPPARFRILLPLTPHQPTLRDAWVKFQADRSDKKGKSIVSDLTPATAWIGVKDGPER